ncbi:MAG: hypothetical protein MJB14_22055 [Spirochaetes bacterium]|nr:hypothetical protein [Spirochaetota bacterium]
MRKQLTIYLLLINFLICLSAVEPVSVSTFFTEKDLARLNNQEIITRMMVKGDHVNENTDLSIPVPSTKYANEDFSVYEVISDEKAFIPYALNEQSKLKFYQTITSYSQLSNVKYWHRVDDRTKVYLEECYTVESNRNNKKIADPQYTKIEPKVTSYIIQQDNKFGKLKYRSEVFNEGNNFIIVNTCTQPIAKFVIRICNKEEFKNITYFIYDEEKQGFYYYTVMLMRIRMEAILKRLYPGTFSNRLRGATVHMAGLLGLDWSDKVNPWDYKKLDQGYYRNF